MSVKEKCDVLFQSSPRSYRLRHSASELSGFTCMSSLTMNKNYRLMHSVSALSGFTCTSSLTINKKFQYPVLKISRAMSVLTFLLFKLNTLHKKNRQTLSQPKPWCNDSGVFNLHHGYYTTIMTSRRLFCHNPVSCGTNQPIRKSEFAQLVYEN